MFLALVPAVVRGVEPPPAPKERRAGWPKQWYQFSLMESDFKMQACFTNEKGTAREIRMLKRIAAITQKEFILMVRDRDRAPILLIPLIQLVLFAYAIYMDKLSTSLRRLQTKAWIPPAVPIWTIWFS